MRELSRAPFVATLSVLAACSSGRGAAPAPAKDGAVPTVAAVDATATSPEARIPGITSVPSAPREHWPCRLTGTINDGVPAERTFVYDGPERCQIPSVLHAEGIVGCPTVYRMTNLELDFSLESIFRYDDQGRLVFRRMGRRGGLKYIWDGDELVADQLVDQEMGDPSPDPWKVVEGKAQHESFGMADAIVTVADGRALHAMVMMLGKSDVTIEWNGPRFAAFEIKPRRDGAKAERFTAEYCGAR